MNASVAQFEEDFRPILDKMQEYDTDQVEFVKFNLEKFSSLLENLGADTQQ